MLHTCLTNSYVPMDLVIVTDQEPYLAYRIRSGAS